MEIKLSNLTVTLSALKRAFHLLILLLFAVSTILLLDTVSPEDRTSTTKISQSTPKCSANQTRKNVVFLKTHKCASSAIQNIFLRFGYKQNLKFVLPMKGNYLGHPALFSHKLVPSGKYNIITHHTRLNYPEMSLIMPPDTIYVTILRDPIALFESMYSYFDLKSFYKFDFKQFDSPSLNDLPSFSKRFANRIGPNQMLFDLGFDGNRSTNLKPYLDYLNSVFDLVMIEEHIDESLVLLKNLLCWSLDDVVAFRVNARIRRDEIGQLAVERIRRLNAADVQLYDFFLEKFKQRVNEFGKERLEREVQQLRSRRRKWFDECVDTRKTKQTLKLSNSVRLNIVQFVTKNEDLTCRLLTAKELELTKMVRTHQLHLYPDSVFTSPYQRTRSMMTREQKNRLFNRQLQTGKG